LSSSFNHLNGIARLGHLNDTAF